MRLEDMLSKEYAIIYKDHKANTKGGMIVKASNFEQAFRFATKILVKGVVNIEIIAIERLYI